MIQKMAKFNKKTINLEQSGILLEEDDIQLKSALDKSNNSQTTIKQDYKNRLV